MSVPILLRVACSDLWPISLRKSWSLLGLTQTHFTKLNSISTVAKVEEIGSVEQENIKRYKSGQCFIHRTFAYRGIILCSWKARLMDRDDKESPKVETYYHVLIDERDAAHIRLQSDVGKFLGGYQKKTNGNLKFSDPGLDQVPHNDVIPYKPTNTKPIQHSSFEKYFVVRQVKGQPVRTIVPKVELHEWKRKHLPWLYYTQVHKMVTGGIRITALSLYMGRKSITHWWRYCIRIENLNKENVVLQSQRWGIYTGNGELQTVRGIGILGDLPVLSPKAPALQYCSHVTLIAPRGHMWGYYLVQKQDAKKTFLCPVPSFALESTLATDNT